MEPDMGASKGGAGRTAITCVLGRFSTPSRKVLLMRMRIEIDAAAVEYGESFRIHAVMNHDSRPCQGAWHRAPPVEREWNHTSLALVGAHQTPAGRNRRLG